MTKKLTMRDAYLHPFVFWMLW